MATIRKRSGRPGYQVRFVDPDGNERSKTFPRKDQAQAFKDRVEVEKKDGEYIGDDVKRQPFEEFWEAWWKGHALTLKPSARARDESYTKNHVLTAFGKRPIGSITYMEVAEWITMLSVEKELAPSTIHKVFACLTKPMRSAVKAKRIPSSPCEDMENLPRIRKKRIEPVTPAIVHDIAAQMPERFAAMPIVMGYCGLRLCELFALRRGRIDFLRKEIHVLEDVVEVRGKVYFDTVKTDAGLRTVPMPRIVMDVLERHMDKYTGIDPDALVFMGGGGGVLRQGNWRTRQWNPAAAGAGVPVLTPHGLRHTAVSLWIAMGASDKQIATWAGHSSVYVVKDLYGHLFPNGAEAIMDRLDQLGAATVVPQMASVTQLGA